ncbi:MAG: hypothetical protein WA709_18830 [Stellaceae bacterium]
MRVFVDLAADNRAQPGHVLPSSPRLRTTTPKHWPHRLDHAVTHDILGSDDQHRSALSQKCGA